MTLPDRDDRLFFDQPFFQSTIDHPTSTIAPSSSPKPKKTFEF